MHISSRRKLWFSTEKSFEEWMETAVKVKLNSRASMPQDELHMATKVIRVMTKVWRNSERSAFKHSGPLWLLTTHRALKWEKHELKSWNPQCHDTNPSICMCWYVQPGICWGVHPIWAWQTRRKLVKVHAGHAIHSKDNRSQRVSTKVLLMLLFAPSQHALWLCRCRTSPASRFVASFLSMNTCVRKIFNDSRPIPARAYAWLFDR